MGLSDKLFLILGEERGAKMLFQQFPASHFRFNCFILGVFSFRCVLLTAETALRLPPFIRAHPWAHLNVRHGTGCSLLALQGGGGEGTRGVVGLRERRHLHARQLGGIQLLQKEKAATLSGYWHSSP